MNRVKSLLKKAIRVIIWGMLILVLVFVIIAGLVQFPAIQTKIIHYATSIISEKTQTKVEIESIRIAFPKTVVIEGIFLEDLQEDTLLYLGKLSMNVVLTDLLFSKVSVNNLELDDVNIHINRIRNDSLFNFNFLITAFNDPEKKVEVKTELESKSKWKFNVDKVKLSNIRFRFDDEYGGVDVGFKLSELKLTMEEIDPVKLIFRIDDLFIDGITADVLIKPGESSEENESDGALPVISANLSQINNLLFTFNDSINNQTVYALIHHLGLKSGLVDLNKELVIADKVFLSHSIARYARSDAEYAVEIQNVIPDTISGTNWKVCVNDIALNDNILAYAVMDKPKMLNAFDVNHMVYRNVSLKAVGFYYSALKTEVSVKEFSAADQNDFFITEFETDFFMDQHSITAKGLKIKTVHSSIVADLNIQFSSLESMKDSFEYIVLNLNILDLSTINSDIVYFHKDLLKQSFFSNGQVKTNISGMINGQINNLKGENLLVRTGDKTVLRTDFRVTGLPEVETAHFHFPDLSLISGGKDIEMFMGSIIPEKIELPENISMHVVFKGAMKSFASTVELNSSYGVANIFAVIDENENFRSKVNVTDFDFGHLLRDTVMFGKVTLSAEANGHGLDEKNMQAVFHANASGFYLNQYYYQNLIMNGTYKEQEFAGKISLDDEYAVFDFDGILNISQNKPQYKFIFNLEGANLQKLNITEEDIKIGCVAEADLFGESFDKLNGEAVVSNLTLVRGDEVYLLDSISLVVINTLGKSELNLSSALISVQYSGNVSPFGLPGEIERFINQYFQISEFDKEKVERGMKNFNFEIQLHNHPILSDVFFPDLKEFEPGIISGSYDSEINDLKLFTSVRKIVYGSNEINNLVIDIHSDFSAWNYNFSMSSISNAAIELDNVLLEGKLANNIIYANVSSVDDSLNKNIALQSQIFKDNDSYKLTLNPEEFYLMRKQWDIAEDHYIQFEKEGIFIHHFFISHAESQVNVFSVNDLVNDEISIEIKNFSLDDLSKTIEKDSGLVRGNLDGNILLKRIDNSYGIIADAEIQNLFVYNIGLGNLIMKANNPTEDKYIFNVSLTGADNNLSVKGDYYPKGGNNSIHATVAIQSLSMRTVEAFSRGQITDASGTLSGDFSIEGSFRLPEISGNLVFNDVFVTPSALNQRLEFQDETIQITTAGINFDSFTILDSEKQTATIDGSIAMRQFSNFVFDINVNMKDFLLMNTTAEDNKEFFGRMIVDSRIDIDGPFDLLVVSGRVKMKEGSTFTFVVPEDKVNTYKGEDVVEFTDPFVKTSIFDNSSDQEGVKSIIQGFEISSIIEIDKKATLNLLMDPSSKDSLVVRGDAALSFAIDKSGKMSLTGSYQIDEGKYIVSLESVIKREFNIISGSTIIWNGDPLDAEININARYSVRAAPFDLVAAQMAGFSDVDQGAYKQQYLFWVMLKLRGEILHPVIGFEIQLPPEDQGILGGAVNQKLVMLNEDESALNKQVFALLIFGRFVQENPLQTETSITSTLVRTTVGNFLSTQLNMLSSKVLPGTEMNFDVQSYDDYESGQAEGRTELEIGIKQQLFNERLSVQVVGSVDVEGERTKQNSASDLTGDVTIEYKLTKDGRYRLKGFRHNHYEGVIDGQLVETGVGIVYVRDFNEWKNFLKAPKDEK